MNKLVLPNFDETKLCNRVISSQEEVREFFTLEGYDTQVFIFGYEPGYIAETHTHKEIRLTLVRLGKMKFTLNGKTMEVNAGDFITILPNVSHGFKAMGESPLKIVEFVII